MRHFKKLITPYLFWSSVIIIIPLFMIFIYAFTKSEQSVLTISFTLDNFKHFAETVYLSVFIKSIKLGLITTAICLVLGYSLAYIITKFSEKTQGILILLVTIPTWINMLLRTYAWMSILCENGIINSFLVKIGLNPINMMYTDFSVILGLVCNFLPFMIIPIYTSLTKIDKSYIEASEDLGANKVQTFLRITVKLSVPGIINGVILVFLPAMSSFVIPKLLGGGQYTLIGNLIENQFISVGDWNFGSAISLVLAVLILIAVRLVKKAELTED